MRKILGLSLLFAIVACNQPATEQAEKAEEADNKPYDGLWRGVIALNDSVDLPFSFELEANETNGYGLVIYNGEEEIETKVTALGEDSIKIEMPVFANYIVAKLGNNKLSGSYINPDAENYVLPFSATYGDSARFEVTEPKCCDINKKWAVKFRPGAENEYPGIAYFDQVENLVKGTFLTETGDYRYLEGVLTGNQLKLSAFDGAHLYVFLAEIKDGQQIEGLHYSGRSSVKKWMAYRDDDFELRNAESLTHLKEGYSTVDFRFENLEGETVSLSDPRFKNKPVIVQIMGSWCPNCMDETRYFNELYDQYHQEGLEIVGLTFERTKDKETSLARAQKMVNDLNIEYPVLLAGSTAKDNPAELLPMLNHIMSFPTSIYLNADHSVRKIHTGFAGPGTPHYFEYTENNRQLIEALLSTQPSKQ